MVAVKRVCSYTTTSRSVISVATSFATDCRRSTTTWCVTRGGAGAAVAAADRTRCTSAAPIAAALSSATITRPQTRTARGVGRIDGVSMTAT